MTTSDKITHAVDVLFLIGIAVLIYFFAGADREHEKELSRLAGTIQQLEGKVIALEMAVKPPGGSPSLSPEPPGSTSQPPGSNPQPRGSAPAQPAAGEPPKPPGQ